MRLRPVLAHRVTRFAPVLLVGALGLAACGGDSGTTAATVPADVDLTVVAADGIKWTADTYAAPSGTITVVLENPTNLPHNLHFIAEDGTENPVILDAPSRGDVVADEVTIDPGTYTLICTIPGHGNMKATLTIE